VGTCTTLAVAAIGSLLAAATAAPLAAQVTTSDSFDWSGRVPAGAMMRVYSVDGTISVSRAAGDQVEVHGVRHYRHYDGRDDRRDGDRSGHDIAFERLQDGDNVTICGYEVDEGSCSTRGVHGHFSHRRWGPSPSADFVVKVPAGVRVTLGTGDGRIDVHGAGADVSASTGDGEISISDAAGPIQASTGDGSIYVSAATGPVEASTGDGSVEVHMTTLPHPQDMHFSTGDGTVTVFVPSNFAGELDATTGDGHVESDFPLQVRGRLDGSHIHATIGGGGATRLTVSTGDGDVRVKRE
jgi:hypothetical protein